jgi:DNA (cytosine-5)-methyltransferase 1
MTCVGQVEIDPFCQKLLNKRWPGVPKVGDIRDCDEKSFQNADLICGGFPCQPFSNAGSRGGIRDDRYLWPEMLRVIEAYGPSWVVGENVAGITTMELGKILASLEGLGYETQCFNLPACAVEAPHERQRIWILAYSRSAKSRGLPDRAERQAISAPGRGRQVIPNPEGFPQRTGLRKGESQRIKIGEPTYRGSTHGTSGIRAVGDVCNSDRAGLALWQGKPGNHGSKLASPFRADWWESESGICRVANGVPNRVDRLRTLGSAIVPRIAHIIGSYIMEIEKGNQNA